MNENKMIAKARTYATAANLGPGYDCAGMALGLYNEHEVYENPENKDCVFIEGNDKHRIATDGNNLICAAIRKTYEIKTGKKFKDLKKNFKIICRIGVPVERGLGSSSTAVVAGLLIADKVFGFKLSQKELLNIGLEIEPHPDNLAPCISGGLVICYRNRKNEVDFKKIKTSNSFKILLVIPDYKVNTNEARKLIPDSFPKEDVIANISNFALLINSFVSGDFKNAADFINDRLHQPYRRSVYPVSMAIVEELNNKIGLPSAIGGSGPTVFSIIPDNKVQDAAEYVEETLKVKYPDFDYKFTSISDKGSYCY
ncbi:MAG: homoserine kinase [Actinomycetota bacterium]|nr:homoserine kinase [Actinomycetota bacterium]